jgi:signal transduction histidine kinase
MSSPVVPATAKVRAVLSARVAFAARLMAFMPSGRTLAPAEFKRRHRTIVHLIWVQAAGLVVFGLANHIYPPIVVSECLLIAALGGLATVEVLAPRFRASIATLALITTSAVIVQLSGGVIEAHFHFFVMLAVIALYQDWVPFLLAILYVAVDHGVIGTIFPHSVYSNPAAIAHPWQWAFIHAAFVLGEAVVLLAGWRIIETADRQAEISRLESEAKSRFLASMSHELRTPLNSVLGFAQLLELGSSGSLSERQTRYVDNIRASGVHLLALVNDVLDLSKIASGQMDLEMASIDLGKILEETIIGMRPLADDRGQRLELDGTAAALNVQADPQRLAQVAWNLISNAIKFTPTGGRVRVTLIAGEDDPGFCVTDNGIGIPYDQMERIFNEFTQVETGRNRRHEGTGLGLPISRQLVELMGGSIAASSKPGQGSTFTVRLRAGIAPIAPATAGPLTLVSAVAIA